MSIFCVVFPLFFCLLFTGCDWKGRKNNKQGSFQRLHLKGSDTDDLVKLHSKRVENMWNYTPNEWRTCEITLQTSVFFQILLKEVEPAAVTPPRWKRAQPSLLDKQDLLNQQSNTTVSFRQLVKSSDFDTLHAMHFDWWMFPVDVRNLQSYWTTTKLWKLTVVLDYYEAM